jgi:uridine kinase
MQSTREQILSANPKVGSSVFVAIDGHGGSGKSTLAELLGTQLGATVVHIDEFAGWDNQDWWPEVIDRVFGPTSEGAAIVTYQPSSWGENHHPETVTKPVTPIMILEGVSSSRTEFADYIGFRIFVDTPAEVCLERGIARDTASGEDEAVVRRQWQDWFAEEIQYMERDNPKQKADIVIDGTKPFESQVVI